MEDVLTTFDELIDALETRGEISITTEIKELFIQTIDDKEGYSYVSNTHEEFGNSREAIQWAIEKLGGIDNIVSWD